MLALMKLGAVIIPATTLLTESDLADRFERGRIRRMRSFPRASPAALQLSGAYTRIAVSGAKIRRVELRQREAEQQREQSPRGAVEFWEEDFPELARPAVQ